MGKISHRDRGRSAIRPAAAAAVVAYVEYHHGRDHRGCFDCFSSGSPFWIATMAKRSFNIRRQISGNAFPPTLADS